MRDASRSAHLVCRSCGKEYDFGQLMFECPCKGLLDVAGLDDAFSSRRLMESLRGVFRYKNLMPSVVDGFWSSATMAEGDTGLVEIQARPRILAKMDYMMPTLSFKDRGASVLMASAKAVGVKEVIQDSSGNAGISVAAYSSRLGIKCGIFVPQSTPPNKVNQIKAYGASVTLVPGSREDTARAALQAARQGTFYASHVYNPLFYQGTKTYPYEIFEQLGGVLPDALAIPLGNGTLLFGIYYGLKSLLAGGQIKSYPKVVCVQASACAPVFKSFYRNETDVAAVSNEGTVADGIAIAAPVRGAQMLSVIRELNATVCTASESGITDEARRLATSGVFVEPTSAATMAGALSWAKASGFHGSIVLPMCGSGLKSLH